MSIIQVKGGGGTTAVDRTSFVGTRIPPEIQGMIKHLAKLDKVTFTKILKVVVGAILESEISPQSLKSVIKDNITEEVFALLYCGIDKLVKQAIKIPSTSLKQEYFIQDLQELQIPAEFHEDLVSCVFGSIRSQLDQYLVSARPRLPSLDHLDWRVDVTISTGVLNRVLVRGVTMDMTLSDGSIKNFEWPLKKQCNHTSPKDLSLRFLPSFSALPPVNIFYCSTLGKMTVSKFQDLRFQVASVLSEMEKLEKRSILKIKD